MRVPKQLRGPVLWGVAGAVVLSIAAAGLAVVVDQRWEEVRRRAQAARQQWESRDFRRPSLHGETREGAAFDAYQPALRLASGLGVADERPLMDMFRRSGKVAAPEADALLARWAPAVAGIRDGAHRDDARRPVDIERGGVDFVNLLASRYLMNVIVIESRDLLAAGRASEAVSVLLDAATFASDLAHAPALIDQMIGTALMAIVTHETWSDELIAALDDAALDLLAAGLARLDARIPGPLNVDGELMLGAWRMLAVVQSGGWDWQVSSWRYGFSSRAQLAASFLAFDDAARRLQRETPTGWAELQEVLTAAEGKWQRWGAAGAWSFSSVEASRRLLLAQLRMLRAAVDLHRRGTTSPASDPFGDGPIGVEESASGWQLTSVGQRPDRPLKRLVVRR